MATNGALHPYRNGFESPQHGSTEAPGPKGDVSPPSVGSLRAAVDRASRELFYLWRSALAANDPEMTNLLIVAGHALHRVTAALDQDAVLPATSEWPWR
jgi:hypothetical protein